MATRSDSTIRGLTADDLPSLPDDGMRRERVEAVTGERGFWPGAPDLAVEVTSPDDSFEEVEEKVFDWLDAGTRMVVVVNPRKRSATVYRSRSEIAAMREGEVLEGGEVVPGWRLPVGEIFG